MDANHVPGSVMLLIKGYFGNILYTGDFRYHRKMFSVPSLELLLKREDVDELYLDNTFFYPTCDFPPREEVLEKIMQILQRFPTHRVYFGLRKLGKESLLVEVAQRLKERILISREKMDLFQLMNLPDVFTTDPTTSRISVVFATLLTRKFMENSPNSIGIIPSALYYGWDCDTFRPYSSSDKYNLYLIEYSDHSSYTELNEFVRHIKPKVVRPIVKTDEAHGLLKEWRSFHRDRIDMSGFSAFLSKLPKKLISRPIDDLEQNEDDRPKKRAKINDAFLKEKVYRGPKGAVYESEDTSVAQLEAIRDQLNQKVTQKALKSLHNYLDEL